MSLEDALNRNSDLMEKHNGLLERLLSKTAGSPAATETTTAADPKATRGKAKDKAPTVDEQREELKPKIAAWLGEFPEADPESKDRLQKMEGALTKLGVKLLGEIKTQELLDRLKKWFENKLAAGRVLPAWTPDEEDAPADDEI